MQITEYDLWWTLLQHCSGTRSWQLAVGTSAVLSLCSSHATPASSKAVLVSSPSSALKLNSRSLTQLEVTQKAKASYAPQ